MQRGLVYAALAYGLWGLFPLYFRAIQQVPPLEVLGHRVVWSVAFLLVVLAAQRRWQWLRPALADRRLLARFVLTATLMAANWLVFIWAVTHGHVLESSLGYFINPLFNVLLGATVLHERLRRGQWLAVGLAALGVAWLGWDAGRPPWIALTLATSFGLYGLLRKTAPLGAIEGLSLETLLLLPPVLALAVWAVAGDRLVFVDAGLSTQALLLAAGPLTAVPLLLFAAGARRIPLYALGMLQYIGPTIQFILGIWLFREPFGGARVVGFGLIWLACALFSADVLWHARRGPSTAGAPAPQPEPERP